MSEQKAPYTAIQKSEDDTKLKTIMRSDEIRGRFAEVIGNESAAGYISSVLIAVSESAYLQKCTPPSIISAALRAATMRLSVEPSTGQAYLVPFKDKATLVIGWRGLYHMAIRTGKYRYLDLHAVYDTDKITQHPMTGIHNLVRGDTGGKVVGYLLYFRLISGFEKTFYMTLDECIEHGKKYSKNFYRDDSLWKTNPEAMCKKTVMRLGLTRWGYLTPSDTQTMDAVDEFDDLPAIVDSISVEPVEPIHPDQAMYDLGFGPEPVQQKVVNPAEVKTLASSRGVDANGLNEMLDHNNGDLVSTYEQLKAL